MRRPALHFTASQGWLNDPNGLLVHEGVFHLFYQHHPHSLEWGPMHWGHASSTDLLHWRQHPIALQPTAAGMAFSGSACLTPEGWLVCYTLHDETAAQAGRSDFQHQAWALSRDGEHWTPQGLLLPNPGQERDFRDPKLLWHAASQCWLMLLAAGQRLQLWRSTDRRAWALASEWNPGSGATLECPDLLPLGEGWLAMWSEIAPGHCASFAQRGTFDGERFSAEEPARRLDHGPDHYAAQAWTPAGADPVLIAWMNDWAYARQVPAGTWRGCMSLPRRLRADGRLLPLLPAWPCRRLQGERITTPCLLRLQGAGDWQLELHGLRLTRTGPLLTLEREAAPGLAWAGRWQMPAGAETLLVLDHGSLEAFSDGAAMSALHAAENPARLRADAGVQALICESS